MLKADPKNLGNNPYMLIFKLRFKKVNSWDILEFTVLFLLLKKSELEVRSWVYYEAFELSFMCKWTKMNLN